MSTKQTTQIISGFSSTRRKHGARTPIIKSIDDSGLMIFRFSDDYENIKRTKWLMQCKDTNIVFFEWQANHFYDIKSAQNYEQFKNKIEAQNANN